MPYPALGFFKGNTSFPQNSSVMFIPETDEAASELATQIRQIHLGVPFAGPNNCEPHCLLTPLVGMDWGDVGVLKNPDPPHHEVGRPPTYLNRYTSGNIC